jgi:hypothetical protein
MATIKKAQSGVKATKDSTVIFQNKAKENFQKASDRYSYSNPEVRKKASEYTDKALQAQKDELRQANKGKKGYDKNGYPLKKKMKNGGSLSGLTASTKRDKGTDVGGAWTKVQNKTLAGARGKAKLTKDKQLGATKMAKRGMSVKKK